MLYDDEREEGDPAEAGAARERAAIVEWLRRGQGSAGAVFADAIARGDHLQRDVDWGDIVRSAFTGQETKRIRAIYDRSLP